MFVYFKKAGNVLFGSDRTDILEHRIFNIACFVSILFALISLGLNTKVNYPVFVNYVIAFSTLVLLVIYSRSRIYKKTTAWLYIITSLLTLSLVWLYSEGPLGSVNFIYIAAIVIFLSITNSKYHLFISIITILNLVILYIIYFKQPQWVIPYQSINLKLFDFMVTIAMVIITVSIIYSSLYQNYRRERNRTERQKIKIETQHNLITESIYYAQEIQSALLQELEDFKSCFSECFMVWYPKNIVSGDFYFFKKLPYNSDKIVVVAGDCTGHGIPGALLSILGITYLNEIIQQKRYNTSNKMLEALREKVIESLSSDKNQLESGDGMDLALCIVDKKNKQIDFAGSNRPLFLIRNGELIELKPNKFPVGYLSKTLKPFKNEIVDIEESDMVYLFTDGYTDQFGQYDSQKFYLKNFRNMLLSHASETMAVQGINYNLRFLDWKGVDDQIDDVLVLGFKPLS